MIWLSLAAAAAPGDGARALQEAQQLIKAKDATADQQLDRAIGMLEEEVKQAPSEATRYTLARGYYSAGRDAAAEGVLVAILASNTEHRDALRMLGAMLGKRGDHLRALPVQRRLVKLEPDDLDLWYNLGVSAQVTGAFSEADQAFQKVLAADPNDWRTLAKRIQLAEAMGQNPQRDALIKTLKALRKSGKIESLVKSPAFCREQFLVGSERVFAYEHFELSGPHGVLYVFRYGKDRISLGSYDETTQMMREMGTLQADQRAWHLDGYAADGSHSTYKIGTKKPTYEQTRAWVVQVLTGTMKAEASTHRSP